MLKLAFIHLLIIMSAIHLLYGIDVASLRDYYQVFDIYTSNTDSNSRNSDSWDPGKGITLEVSGIANYDKERLIMTLRKGDVVILHNPKVAHIEGPKFTTFASGLHEPLGIVKKGSKFYVAQRTEITELSDLDHDDIADSYLCYARPWNVTGNYHEYAYGPELDSKGNLWCTTNLGMGDLSSPNTPWRGWGIKVGYNRQTSYVAAGMRSPCGLGRNLNDDIFFSDQQGNYIPTNTLHHLREGVFFGNPDAYKSINNDYKLPDNIPYPEALKIIPNLVAPCIWFPYLKMGRSTTDVVCDTSESKFGPFEGQLFIGEFTHSGINRVFLEKVNNEYQGACFPFLNDFPAGVVRLNFSEDGSLYVGMTNRGWNSLGGASFGLHRVSWNKKIPFELKTMQAQPTGFKLTFTKPVNKASALDPNSYRMINYTYNYSSKYGGAEILTKTNHITKVDFIDDFTVLLHINGLTPYHVHELHCDGVEDTTGAKLIHADAYYTLNHIPNI